jgi:hypothetical protein
MPETPALACKLHQIDGTLMQVVGRSRLQQRVREFVDQAKEKQVSTIAERVQDANDGRAVAMASNSSRLLRERAGRSGDGLTEEGDGR